MLEPPQVRQKTEKPALAASILLALPARATMQENKIKVTHTKNKVAKLAPFADKQDDVH